EGEALWSPRWDHSMAVFNGKIFLTGGMDLKDNVFNDEWVSSDGLHWELITSNAVWLPRQGHSLLTASDKLWLIGRLPDPQNTNDQNDVWTSTDGKNWEKFNEAVPWEGREDFGSAVFQNKIWILAGMDSHYRWRNDIWSLDLR
ncbi:MAG TPA: kelch repeat-containing protein, partial [Candidatus Pacearchaeota archaeon]|nr:kelch repeat-containing protein [Candidatus Pacearchaeota archaeon]